MQLYYNIVLYTYMIKIYVYIILLLMIIVLISITYLQRKHILFFHASICTIFIYTLQASFPFESIVVRQPFHRSSIK